MTPETTTLRCPNCHSEIPLSAAMDARMREEIARRIAVESDRQRREYEQKVRELGTRETTLRERELTIEREVAERAEKQRAVLTAEIRKSIQADQDAQFTNTQRELIETKAKLKEFATIELQLRAEKQRLVEEREQLDLQRARQIDAERDQIRAAARKQTEEEYLLKLAEKEKQIEDMARQASELKRRSEQGSQQAQGEALELSLESSLRDAFPSDEILPVPKGIAGGDLIQRVMDSRQRACGAILWETKRTKAWSDGWIAKLRDDQLAARADVCAIVTIALPRDAGPLTERDGVWITTPALAIALAAMLRATLLEVSGVRRAQEGRNEKVTALYDYLSGGEFKRRVQTIVDAFVAQRDALDQERRAMTKIWSQREKQLTRAITNAAEMYGELAAIVDRPLPAIESLDLRALPAPAADDLP